MNGARLTQRMPKFLRSPRDSNPLRMLVSPAPHLRVQFMPLLVLPLNMAKSAELLPGVRLRRVRPWSVMVSNGIGARTTSTRKDSLMVCTALILLITILRGKQSEMPSTTKSYWRNCAFRCSCCSCCSCWKCEQTCNWPAPQTSPMYQAYAL